jgi:hypothetical protein
VDIEAISIAGLLSSDESLSRSIGDSENGGF